MKGGLIAFLAAGIFLSAAFTGESAFAKTTITTTEYSVGFSLDENSCDFGSYTLPEDFNAMFLLKKYVKTTKKGKTTSYSLQRSGKFPVQVQVKTLKVTKRGFTSSGTKVMSARAFSEKITLSAGSGGGTATLVMKVVEGGLPCQFVYSGPAQKF